MADLYEKLRADLSADLRAALNWWDVLDQRENFPGSGPPRWAEVLGGSGYSIHILPCPAYPSTKVELIVNGLADRFELMLRVDYSVAWQRTLFFRPPAMPEGEAK